jgi:hypothetical protein
LDAAAEQQLNMIELAPTPPMRITKGREAGRRAAQPYTSTWPSIRPRFSFS